MPNPLKLSLKPLFLIDRLRGWMLITFGIFITFAFAFGYWKISHFNAENGLIKPAENVSFSKGINIAFSDALYFSITTETTLGLGDIRPVGAARWLACVQVFLGLILAGVIVAKLTSAEGKEQRITAHKCQGYWIEKCIMQDTSVLFTFVQFTFNRILRYDGTNYDINGEDVGFFKGELILETGNSLQFRYSNKQSFTTFFDEGVADLLFRSKPNSKLWTNYSATAHDFGKRNSIGYEGFRATNDEILIFLGNDISKRKEVVKKYAGR